VFSFSIIISVYHFGIEQGFVEESTVCASQNIDLMTREQILNSLKELNISCKNVAFRIFGLSLTTYNLFTSVLMLIMSLKILSLTNNHDIKK
jgi:disulfide bond formation protein DsbB